MTEEAKAARKAYLREYRKKNAERINAYNRSWRRANPEKAREYNARYWKKRAAREA